MEAEGNRNEEEAKMAGEERFYVVSEDPYRGMSLKFEGKSSEGSLEGRDWWCSKKEWRRMEGNGYMCISILRFRKKK